MAEPSETFARQAERLNAAILAIEDGASEAPVGPTTRTAAELPTLYDELRLASIRAAIRAIEGGAQAYTVVGRTFQKASYRDLIAQEQELVKRIDRQARGGVRVRHGVPVP